MSRPWTGAEVLLVGHSQMEGMAPHLRERLHRDGARVVHVYAHRGLSVRQLRRDVQNGLRLVPRATADTLALVVVGLSGNGAVLDPLELAAHLDWVRAEYPRALLVWLGYTLTRTGTRDDADRAQAAELERRVVPRRPGFLWVDMRAPEIPHASDGLHFDRDGYRRLAERAWRAMRAGTAPKPGVPWLAALTLGAVLAVGGVYALSR